MPRSAFLGSVLAVKPLLEVTDGHIAPVEKIRTSARALARLEDLTANRAGSASVRLGVHHLAAPERAEKVRASLAARLPDASPILVRELGAVIGAHVGPGVVAVAVAPRSSTVSTAEGAVGVSSSRGAARSVARVNGDERSDGVETLRRRLEQSAGTRWRGTWVPTGRRPTTPTPDSDGHEPTPTPVTGAEPSASRHSLQPAHLAVVMLVTAAALAGTVLVLASAQSATSRSRLREPDSDTRIHGR